MDSMRVPICGSHARRSQCTAKSRVECWATEHGRPRRRRHAGRPRHQSHRVTRHDSDSTAAIDSAAKPSEDSDISDRTSPLAALGLAPRPPRPPPRCRPTRTVPASRRTRQQWLEFDTHPRRTSSSTNARRGSNGRRDQHASEIRQARGDLTQFAPPDFGRVQPM